MKGFHFDSNEGDLLHIASAQLQLIRMWLWGSSWQEETLKERTANSVSGISLHRDVEHDDGAMSIKKNAFLK